MVPTDAHRDDKGRDGAMIVTPALLAAIKEVAEAAVKVIAMYGPLADKAQSPKSTHAPTESQMFSPTVLIQVLSMLPQLVNAVEAILASDGAHTIESAVKVLLDHNTPGQPNAPALAPKT